MSWFKLFLAFALTWACLSGAYHWGVHVGQNRGAARMRDAILCVIARTAGDEMQPEACRACAKAGTTILPKLPRPSGKAP